MKSFPDKESIKNILNAVSLLKSIISGILAYILIHLTRPIVAESLNKDEVTKSKLEM